MKNNEQKQLGEIKKSEESIVLNSYLESKNNSDSKILVNAYDRARKDSIVK